MAQMTGMEKSDQEMFVDSFEELVVAIFNEQAAKTGLHSVPMEGLHEKVVEAKRAIVARLSAEE